MSYYEQLNGIIYFFTNTLLTVPSTNKNGIIQTSGLTVAEVNSLTVCAWSQACVRWRATVNTDCSRDSLNCESCEDHMTADTSHMTFS